MQLLATLHHGTAPVRRPAGENYHLTEDLASRAIEWMRLQRSLRPERPFFVYLAPGATHAPLQVPEAWTARFQGRFDAASEPLEPLPLKPRKADVEVHRLALAWLPGSS